MRNRVKKFHITLIYLLMGPSIIFAQKTHFSLGVWNFQQLYGILAVEGRLSRQETLLKTGHYEQHDARNLFGEILLNSKSHIWHPSFILFNMEMEYRPGVVRDDFLIMPFRTETSTLGRFYARMTIFNQKPISLSLYTHLNKSFINREWSTSVEKNGVSFGGSLLLRNRILPIKVDYSKDKWEQKELATARKFFNHSEKLQTKTNKSFSDLDAGRLTLSYEKYHREYSSNVEVNNEIVDLLFVENINFNQQQSSGLNSRIWYTRQSGSDRFNRLMINQNLRTILPANFTIKGDYQYNKWEQVRLSTSQHSLSGSLEHQLYKSLRSTLHFERILFTHSDYDNKIQDINAGVHYRKKIPTGQFSLFYEYGSRLEDRQNEQGIVRINNEEHRLSDSEITLLDNPDVITSTVAVWDEARMILYEENLDYILISRGVYLEVQRLPGGQIPPNSIILVDYEVRQPFIQKYTRIRETYGGRISLLKNMIEFYARIADHDFDNVFLTDPRLLKIVLQRIYGGSITYGFFTGGYEIDDYDSNIVPYYSQKYFLSFSGRVNNKMAFSIIGNLRELLLNVESERQSFKDVSGRISYSLGLDSKINVNGGYRLQRGRQIDLDLFTLRAELVTRLRQIYFTFGLEGYRRDYSGERIDYSNLYLRISRNI